MKLPRRKFLHLAAGAAALPAVARIARAQTYPTKPVRILVGFAPGGGVDIIARLMGQWLSERLGQPFLIENRPGAGSNIPTEAVVRAPADGYTLLHHGTSTTRNALDATQTITSRWAQFRRDGFFNPNKLSAKARRHYRGVLSTTAWRGARRS
jgi:tripartite-type tricarboxylate transporter receptor subunit TctC